MAGYVLLAALFVCVQCETSTESTAALLSVYSNYVNSSLELDKNDRRIMKGWISDYQVQQVNVTTHYRLEMTRHKEHNFQWINANTKWNECKDLHAGDLVKTGASYYTEENACLRATSAAEGNRRHAVYQVDKEIRKWRKSYRYLVNQCKSNNPGDDAAAGRCLVNYMTRDNYHVTFQRLILLKLDSMSELFAQMLRSVRALEECLRRALTLYLASVRRISQNVNQCYNIKNKT